MTRARTLAVARIGLFTFAALATVALAVGIAGGKHEEPGPPVTARADGAGPRAPDSAFADTLTPLAPAPTPSADSPPPHGAPAEDAGPTNETASGVEDAAPDSEDPAPTPDADRPAPELTPNADEPAQAPDIHPAPGSTPPLPTLDVSGAADYVRAFYADLSERNFRAAWPHLAADLRERHGSFDAWRRGFATTLSQSAAEVIAAAAGPTSAQVSLTLTAVDRDRCKREVTRRFAVVWRLDQDGDEWRAVHAEAKPLKPAPSAVAASC